MCELVPWYRQNIKVMDIYLMVLWHKILFLGAILIIMNLLSMLLHLLFVCDFWKWHARLCHIGQDRMNRLARDGLLV